MIFWGYFHGYLMTCEKFLFVHHLCLKKNMFHNSYVKKKEMSLQVYFLFTYCIKIGWRHIIDVRKYVGVKGQGHFSFDSGLFFTLDFFQLPMNLFLNYYIIQRRGTCFLWTYRTRVWTQKTQGKDSPVAIAYSDKYTLMYGDFSFFWLTECIFEREAFCQT